MGLLTQIDVLCFVMRLNELLSHATERISEHGQITQLSTYACLGPRERED